MSESKPRSSRVRCGNTIHSNYVTDHRCLREREHPGDCLFGAGNAVLLDNINELVRERDDLFETADRLRESVRLRNEVIASHERMIERLENEIAGARRGEDEAWEKWQAAERERDEELKKNLRG